MNEETLADLFFKISFSEKDLFRLECLPVNYKKDILLLRKKSIFRIEYRSG